MLKLSKTAGMKLIIAELEKCTATLDILAVISSKWQLAEKTFYNWLKVAKKQHETAQSELNSKVADVVLIETIDAQKTALKEASERKAILQQKFIEVSKVKRGKFQYKDSDGNPVGEPVKVTLADELKAIDTLTKLDDRLSKADGTDKPTKTANTDASGKDVPRQIIIQPVQALADKPNEPE